MGHPETDNEFRNRLLKVMRCPDVDVVFSASGPVLDSLGRMNGLARKGVPEGQFTDPIVEAFRDVERSLNFGHPQKALGESDEEFAARCKTYWGLPT